MNKLSKFKEWLTVTDAAENLSIAFGEKVCEADVLRFALDGRLRLSVYFVNHASARCGKVVGYEDAEWGEFPAGMGDAFPNLPEELKGKPVPYMRSLNLDDVRFLTLEDTVTTLREVWDLPMIGNERLDVEHRYQYLTGGPPVTLGGLDGAFVERRDGRTCQLQESFDENEFQKGSSAHLRKIERQIAEKDLSGEEAESLRKEHKRQREIFLEWERSQRKAGREADNYYPANGLPKDSVLVVRTDALREFERHINDGGKEEKALSTTERNSLLKMVIGMAIRGYGYDPVAKKSSTPGEISKDLGLLGMKLDPETVLKFLREATDKVLPAKTD